METVRVNDLETARVHEGLDFAWTALNLGKKAKIADLALMKWTPSPCNCKLTSLKFVKISMDCDSQDTVSMTPSDHERPQGGGNTGICPPLEIGTKKQKFLNNLKSVL